MARDPRHNLSPWDWNSEPTLKWHQVNGKWYRFIPGGGWFTYEGSGAPPSPMYNGVGVVRSPSTNPDTIAASANSSAGSSTGSGQTKSTQPAQKATAADGSAPAPSTPIQPGTDAAGDGTVWDATSQMLADAGLSDLLPWYRQKLTEGASSYEIAILIQEQPAFKNRFKAIEERKNLGLPAISPSDVLAYEKQARGLMRGAGLPGGFYDHFDDYKDLLVADVSLAELADRIQDGYTRVQTASTALKTAFYNFYGAQGDDMLAAYFLDPAKAVPILTRQVEAAGIGGVGMDFGFDLSRGRSEYLAANEIRASQARQAFAALTEREGLFEETYAEQAAGEADYRLEFEGLDAALGLSGDAIRRLEERRRKRVAQFSGALGGALVNQAGFAFGSSRA